MMKEVNVNNKSRNLGLYASNVLSLALICCFAWQNSSFMMREQALRTENQALQKESAAALAKLEELEKLAENIVDLGAKLDSSELSAGQLILARSKATAPMASFGDMGEGEGCIEENWFEGANSSFVAKRLTSLQDRLHQLSATLTQVNVNLEQRKVALDGVPTILPVNNGEIGSRFGVRMHPRKRVMRQHRGVDIKAPHGSPVLAAAKGTVIGAGAAGGYGLLVTISHDNGIETKYAHNSKLAVKVGQKVEKGQVIAKVGRSGLATGAHCHYEVLIDGTPVNPELFLIDKTPLLDGGAKHVLVKGSDSLGIRKNSTKKRSL